MSEAAANGGGAPAPPVGVAREWRLREASEGDVAAVVAAVGALLDELGGRRPSEEELEREVAAAIADRQGASLLLAEAGGEVVGVLSASWQRALHVPGLYATIQDLWVGSAWRSRGVGADLVAALAELARDRGVARLEVGLPKESFANIRATEGFYLRNGFESLGPRMRRLLP